MADIVDLIAIRKRIESFKHSKLRSEESKREIMISEEIIRLLPKELKFRMEDILSEFGLSSLSESRTWMSAILRGLSVKILCGIVADSSRKKDQNCVESVVHLMIQIEQEAFNLTSTRSVTKLSKLVLMDETGEELSSDRVIFLQKYLRPQDREVQGMKMAETYRTERNVAIAEYLSEFRK